MRDYKVEFEKRVEFIRQKVKEAHADGVVFGNSGGKREPDIFTVLERICFGVRYFLVPRISTNGINKDKVLATSFSLANSSCHLR